MGMTNQSIVVKYTRLDTCCYRTWPKLKVRGILFSKVPHNSACSFCRSASNSSMHFSLFHQNFGFSHYISCRPIAGCFLQLERVIIAPHVFVDIIRSQTSFFTWIEGWKQSGSCEHAFDDAVVQLANFESLEKLLPWTMWVFGLMKPLLLDNPFRHEAVLVFSVLCWENDYRWVTRNPKEQNRVF